jgi:Holliday junction resolvasome RuvABC endonuclease subunit
MKTVLAFDQAFQNTGWAVGTSDGPVACGLIVVSPRRFDSLVARFLRFEKGIRELLHKHRPALVVFEEHRAHAGVQAAQVLGACAAILMKCCDEEGGGADSHGDSRSGWKDVAMLAAAAPAAEAIG